MENINVYKGIHTIDKRCVSVQTNGKKFITVVFVYVFNIYSYMLFIYICTYINIPNRIPIYKLETPHPLLKYIYILS